MNTSHEKQTENERYTTSKAELGKRILAFLIDVVIAGFATALISMFSVVLGSVIGAAYFLVRDGLEVEFMHGRSLGKKLMNLRPVKLNGEPMDLEASIRRNWMFSISGIASLSFFGFIQGILSVLATLIFLYEAYRVFTSPNGRRWGDEIAETMVVEA